MKFKFILAVSILSALGYSCADQSLNDQTLKTDDSYKATSGGLELSQPILDSSIKAKYFIVTIRSLTCGNIQYSDSLVPPPSDAAPSTAEKKTTVAETATHGIQASKIRDHEECPISDYLVKDLFTVKAPFAPGELIRLKAPNGRVGVKVQIAGERGILLEGSSQVDVVDGKGQVNVVLFPVDSQLIVTTTIGAIPEKEDPKVPVNPLPEVKDFLKFPGPVETVRTKPGVFPVRVFNDRRIGSIQEPEIVFASDKSGISISSGVRQESVWAQVPEQLKPISRHDIFTCTFSKPGTYIVRIRDMDRTKPDEVLANPNLKLKVFYFKFEVH